MGIVPGDDFSHMVDEMYRLVKIYAFILAAALAATVFLIVFFRRRRRRRSEKIPENGLAEGGVACGVTEDISRPQAGFETAAVEKEIKFIHTDEIIR
jgi:hypothetical protein